jgi:RNA recognition motif-containing protein
MAGERPSKFRRERDDDEHMGHDHEMQDDRGSPDCAVFVTDIARGVTDEMLKEKFKAFGNVVEAFVVKNKYTGDTKGYGFVHFTSMDEVYGVLDAKELPRFEDSVSHKMYALPFDLRLICE